MTNIDLETGLPALENDEFWRLRKANPPWSSFEYPELQIVKTITSEKQLTWDILGLFTIPRGAPVKVVTDKVLYQMPLWDSEKEPYSDDDNRIQITVEAPDGKKYRTLDVNQVTEEHIREAADWILTRRVMAEKSDSFYGSYPPKSLNREEPR